MFGYVRESGLSAEAPRDRPLRLVGTDSVERTDDELMLLARGGLASAFETLVLRHQRRMYNVALKQLGAEHRAADAVQETFIGLYRALPRYRPEGKLPVLLYRILLNQIRRNRRWWWRSRLELVDELPARTADATQEAAILERERAKEVRQAIQRLPRRYREVVTLRFDGDLTYREVADVLEVPVGTVKSRLHTALGKLEATLGGLDL